MAVGEWDQRQLCPDGACVGVIGPDGTCKACGRAAPNWGDERKRGLIDPPDEDDQDGEVDDDEDDLAAGDGAADGDEYDDDDEEDPEDSEDDDSPEGEEKRAYAAASREWGSRRLCPDGTCIGVIGPSGRCKVCGRSASAGADSGAKAAPADGALAATGHGGSASGAVGNAIARVGCADAACPGAIGPDGRCDVCGKVAA
jgi:hypothetical protein